MSNGILFTVQTLHGTVYALQELSTGMIWTERSEHAALQLARERRVSIIQEQAVSHEELLRLMGHEPMALKASVPAKTVSTPAPSAEPPRDDVPIAAPAAPLSSAGIAVRYHWEDEADEAAADAIVIPRTAAPPVKSVFCSEGVAADSVPPLPQIVENKKADPQHKPPPTG